MDSNYKNGEQPHPGGRPRRVGGLSADEFSKAVEFLTRFTVEDIADRLGVSVSAIRSYRIGKYAVPERVEVKLKKLLTEKTLPDSIGDKLK